MSTIERAAARLGVIGKRGSPQEQDRREPAVEGEVRTDGAAAPTHDAPAQDSSGELPHARSFVGGGFVELDAAGLAEKGFVIGGVESELATDFRRIKRPLLLAVKKAETESGENPANLIVVTSSLPGEGKTFTSLNLAFSIAAEMDRSVLLVDGDVAKSAVTEVLGFRYDTGLTDVLAKGGAGIEDCVLRTNVHGLEILPSGPWLTNADELFASDLMRRLIHGLARQDPKRLVLIDAPPLLVRTEAPNLARLAGHVVVVVEADKTPQASVTESLSLLQGCERVSLVLNKVTRRAFDRHAYGYGYGYGYGQDAARRGH
jgi:exopolysaccharide/PEP-CTERM locus tyrosine autokinase